METTSAKPATKKKTSSKPAAPKREFKGDEELIHDLVALDIADVIRNVSYTDTPRYERLKHMHFFHSIDSSGRKMYHTSPVAGHKHELELAPMDESMLNEGWTDAGKGWMIKCGPPLKKSGKHWLPDPADQHTHTGTKKPSERLTKRVNNELAQRILAGLNG